MREKTTKIGEKNTPSTRMHRKPLSVHLNEESLRKIAKTGERCILCFNTIKSSPGLWSSYLKQFRKMQFMDSVDINALCSSSLGIFAKLNDVEFKVDYVKWCFGIDIDEIDNTKICNACTQQLTKVDKSDLNFDLDVTNLINTLWQRRHKHKLDAFTKCKCNGCNKQASTFCFPISGLLLLFLFSDCVATDQPSPFLPPDFVPSFAYRSDSYDTLSKFISLCKSYLYCSDHDKANRVVLQTYLSLVQFNMLKNSKFIYFDSSKQEQLGTTWKEGYHLLVNRSIDAFEPLLLIKDITVALSGISIADLRERFPCWAFILELFTKAYLQNVSTESDRVIDLLELLVAIFPDRSFFDDVRMWLARLFIPNLLLRDEPHAAHARKWYLYPLNLSVQALKEQSSRSSTSTGLMTMEELVSSFRRECFTLKDKFPKKFDADGKSLFGEDIYNSFLYQFVLELYAHKDMCKLFHQRSLNRKRQAMLIGILFIPVQEMRYCSDY